MNTRNRILLLLCLGFLIMSRTVYGHYPHDAHDFIVLSPSYSTDGTVFTSQKQGASIRPHVALVSNTRGFTWEFNPVGMDNTSAFNSAAVSPNYDIDNTVFMTTDNDGAYRSVDGGISWSTVNQELPTMRLSSSSAILDNQGNVNFFVSGSTGGLYKTGDYGATWDTVLAGNIIATAFAISPTFSSDGTILAGESTGLMHISVDGGTSFTQITQLSGIGNITDIVFSPDYISSGVIYASTSSGLYSSNDFGTTFTKVESLVADFIYTIAISPTYASDTTLFATTPTEIYKSTDAGISWNKINIDIHFSKQTNIHFFDIQFSDDYITDQIVYLASFEGVYLSSDGGSSWFQLDTRPPELIMGVAVSPDFSQDGVILASTYGSGLFVSRDAGNSWTVANTGVSNTYTYQVEIRRGSGPDPILIASQQNHTLVSTDYGASWTRSMVTGVLSKDCIPSAMDASPTFVTDPAIILGCRKRGFISTFDGGNSWQTLFTESQLAGATVTSAQLSTNFINDPTMFFTDARGNFFRSNDNGLNWQLINNGLPSANYWFGGNSVVLSPDYANDSSLLGVTAKGLHISIDSGDSWNSLPSTSPVATGVIEYAEIAPGTTQTKTILASVRGQGLYRSDDSGSSWQQVGSGLLENGYELKGFAYSPDFTQDGVVIGFGHDHIMRSIDRGNTFQLIDLPFTRHEDVREQSIIYVGSWTEITTEAASGTTVRANATRGNMAVLPFWGTGVSWIGLKADVLGKAKVYIDGQLAATVDQYSPTPLWQQSLFSVSGLSPGLHIIYVVTTRDKNPNALANWTVVDAFDVIR